MLRLHLNTSAFMRAAILVACIIAAASAHGADSNGVGRDTIVEVQRSLIVNGYNAGSIDGVAGPQTREALEDYQFDNNLPVTGEITEQVIDMLLGLQIDKVLNDEYGDELEQELDEDPLPDSKPLGALEVEPEVAGIPKISVDVKAAPSQTDPGYEWLVMGDAEVVDGDTLSILGVKVGLYGIDAPEPGQTCRRADGTPWACGGIASKSLSGLIGDKKVKCFGGGDKLGDLLDDRGRKMAICWTVNPMDDDRQIGHLNRDMVLDGWAMLNPPQKLPDYYNAYERLAKKKHLGIWTGDFTPPWMWRNRDGG